MAYGSPNRWATSGSAATQAQLDVGLRRYMLQVYNYMASGLALTGVVAYAAAASGFYRQIAGTPVMWIVMLAPFALVFFFSFRIHQMALRTAQLTFWVYAALMGLSLAGIFLLYTGASIASTFFITAGTFAAMSLVGYTTKVDLSRFGSFLYMGLIGIVIASLVNMFMASSALNFAISVIGVLLFTGLTAFDTQRIKEAYVENAGGDVMAKTALYGALQLYLDFLNLFLFLLRFMGVSSNRN